MEIELRREDKSKGRDFEKFTSLLQIIFQYISIGHNNGLILYYFSKLWFSKSTRTFSPTLAILINSHVTQAKALFTTSHHPNQHLLSICK